MRGVLLAACVGVLVLSPWASVTAAAQSPEGGPAPGAGIRDPELGDPGAEVALEQSIDSGGVSRAASHAAARSAVARLEASPPAVSNSCGTSSGVEVCARRRLAVESTPALERQGDPASGAEARGARTSSAEVSGAEVSGAEVSGAEVSGAEVSDVTLGHASAVCDGSGSDGFRVQPVYAYVGPEPDPDAIALISGALANVEDTFTDSAAVTGGWRGVRWVTDSGSAGCKVVLRTAQITSGATDYFALMADLEGQGAVPESGVGTTKHLVWTEGEIFQPESPTDPRPSTCGLGESFPDESPLDLDHPNYNLDGTRAAVDDRCWDINGGGSVPAHELMHTLGAVQDGAPNYANEGHCNDEYDLMCYGPGMTYPCAISHARLFDCNNDDYFNTDPLVGSYLCSHWNTADSLYLEGWNQVQAPRAVSGLSVTASAGRINVKHSGTASCYGADFYRITVQGVGSYDTASLAVGINAPAGTRSVTVAPHSPYGDVFGEAVAAVVTVPPANRLPVGKMVLSLTDGRGYGMLGYAIDPDTGAPVRMRMVIPGVVNREYNWNYRWADMPAYTGWNRTEALLFLAQLPPGTHKICFDARDANTGAWTRLDCRTHTVK